MLLKELEKEEDVLSAVVDARVTESNDTRLRARKQNYLCTKFVT